MRSRKEQLQAYQFLRRRIGAALLSGEPDTLDPPMRRVVRTTFAGVMVGIIVIAVFAIYGLVRPGGATGWKVADGSLVIEKETGAAYVYHGGKLHPMLNYASARLYLGQADAQPHRVSRGSLEGTPRAVRKGIPGAPHSLPDPKELVTEPWTVCAEPNGPNASTVTLIAGDAPPGGDLADNEALVVTAGSNHTYLVWRDKRYFVEDPRILGPLQLSQRAQEVGVAWLNALPPGPEIDYPELPNAGSPGPTLDNGTTTVVGQLWTVNYGDRQQWVLTLPDGFARIPEFAGRVIQQDPDLRDIPNRPPKTMSPGAFAQVTQVPPPSGLNEYPSGITKAANADQAQRGVLCVTTTGTGDSGTVERTVSATARVPYQGVPLSAPAGAPVPLADNFYIKAGKGAVVAALPHPKLRTDLQPNSRFLITDRGIRYPIAGQKALEALGYGKADIARLPVTYLKMLPKGPTLSRRAATQPAAPGGAQQTGGQQASP